jgi:hypothetical protein
VCLQIFLIVFLILEDLGDIRVIPDTAPEFLRFLWGYTKSELTTHTLIRNIGDKMSQHDTLLAAFETYKAENEKFIEKGVKASAARARKALQEIAGACKERRKEITATKEAMEAKK